jgi:glucose dehydrogenase
MRGSAKPPTVTRVTLLAIASLGITGCQGASNPSAAACTSKAPTAPATAPAAAAAWTLPGANLQNTRDVASPITSANVAKLGVAWCGKLADTVGS